MLAARLSSCSSLFLFTLPTSSLLSKHNLSRSDKQQRRHQHQEPRLTPTTIPTMTTTTTTTTSSNNNDNIHAEAFNLARRYSSRNENDLMQESFVDDNDDDNNTSNKFSESYCSSLLTRHMPPTMELPTECFRYNEFRSGVIRRDSQRVDANVAFAGMDAHAQLKAKAALDSGHLSPAQIKRRLTSKSKKMERSWF